MADYPESSDNKSITYQGMCEAGIGTPLGIFIVLNTFTTK